MEETQISKSCRAENPERKEKTSPLNKFKLRGMVNLVKRIPKEKTCQRGKRQLLILVLSVSTNVLWKPNNERKK